MHKQPQRTTCAQFCLLILAMLACFATELHADTFTPSHSCRKPYKPLEFRSEFEVDSFNDDARRYKRCLDKFVEEQKEAIETHRAAAKAAIEDWNRFVRLELR